MTIIESFDKAPIDNLISSLTTKADKIIFLGEITAMKNAVSIYQNILKKKNINITITLKEINKNDLSSILDILTEIVETENNCIFDITGGDDLVLLGFGIIYERYKNLKEIQLQRFDIPREDFPLNVQELISIYGGVVLAEEPQPISENAVNEINKIWNITKKNCSKWNKSISYLKELERKGDESLDPLKVDINLRESKHKIDKYDFKYHEVSNFLKELASEDLIFSLIAEQDIISYKYKNLFIKRCLSKAGDALEMKSYIEALTLTENGKPYFNDCYVSVNIDWDGIIHPIDKSWKDTTNEIDLILMKGLTPIFISCKNGKIGEEELYKLNTVAARFGGKYAKKMLIATNLQRESYIAKQSYMQRAKDMGVILVPNAKELSDLEWKNIFKQI